MLSGSDFLFEITVELLLNGGASIMLNRSGTDNLNDNCHPIKLVQGTRLSSQRTSGDRLEGTEPFEDFGIHLASIAAG